jgi:hypothetical protein
MTDMISSASERDTELACSPIEKSRAATSQDLVK